MSAKSDPPNAPLIFISYAREDIKTVRRLHRDLKARGLHPWPDEVDILPGRDGRLLIEEILKNCTHFIAVISDKSNTKEGVVQKELRMDLERLAHKSPRETFPIPLRLEELEPVHPELAKIHRVDLFEGYDAGLRKLLQV